MNVLNVYHVGGIEGIPPNDVFIGRPSVYGNRYSSKSGLYSKEECVALHRVDLYQSLIKDPLLFNKVKEELFDKDLYCFCKSPKYVKACHGDNYAHIFDLKLSERVYDKSVVHYLMDDFRRSMGALITKIMVDLSLSDFLKLYLTFHETKLEIEDLFKTIKKRKSLSEDVSRILSYCVIDCEYAVLETDSKMILYRLDHLVWQIHRWMDKREDRDFEPISPHLTLKRKRIKHA